MTSKVFVYEHPVSPYAQSVKIALREKGIPFSTSLPNDPKTGQAAPTFKTANPRLEVPALIDGDVQLFETPIILEYIEDKWPSPSMFSKDPVERAEARLSGHVVLTQYEAVLWAVGSEIRLFQRAEGKLAEEIVENCRKTAAALQEWLVKRLGENEYFSGSEFGYADMCIAPIVASSVNGGMGPGTESKLYQWLERVKQRKSVRETFDEAKEGMKIMPSKDVIRGPRPGFKREYRDHRLDMMVRAGGIEVVVEGLKRDNVSLVVACVVVLRC
jgi:glutathione S-transferase